MPEPVIARHAAGGVAGLALSELAEQLVDIEAHATLKDLVY